MTRPPDIGTLASLAVAIAIAINQFRLIRANRRKVLAEGSDLSTQAADRMLRRWEADNKRLRADNQQLMKRVVALERRCDKFERVLNEHNIPLPALD